MQSTVQTLRYSHVELQEQIQGILVFQIDKVLKNNGRLNAQKRLAWKASMIAFVRWGFTKNLLKFGI